MYLVITYSDTWSCEESFPGVCRGLGSFGSPNHQFWNPMILMVGMFLFLQGMRGSVLLGSFSVFVTRGVSCTNPWDLEHLGISPIGCGTPFLCLQNPYVFSHTSADSYGQFPVKKRMSNLYAICSMYGIFTFISHKFMPNVGRNFQRSSKTHDLRSMTTEAAV